MSKFPKIKIITEFGELFYRNATDLNITLNRIVDDFTDVSNRFGDFSYEFYVPIIKENSKVFSYVNSHGAKKVFPKNQNIKCQVFNDNLLLLDGLLNLEGLTQDSYKCKLYSKFKELIDTLNEKTDSGEDKTLRDLNLPVVHDWDYETTIINHINANYKNSDETTHQYPLSFYSTMYCQTSYFSGYTDNRSYSFRSDNDYQNYYYMFNDLPSVDNRTYIHQYPPAIYIVSIVRQILTDAGWKLGGQFFNDSNVKKIVLTYAGEDDIYDQATNAVSGSTSLDLHIAKFLPKDSQSDFLKGIINYFNLYFRIDINNKIIEFETYDTYFNNGNISNPYDVTGKINNSSTLYEISYILNNDPSIKFKNSLNTNVMGDNLVMSGATNNAFVTILRTNN